ncbi:MAG: short-chain dehydrogenase/reductase SDR [Monoraphidium minutum]|nr:MAG: short-chain dehydrogenase/reductase SDR [Monoraphidium minutum]
MLAESGWRVYAGVRNAVAAADVAALHAGIEPLTIDVGSTESVRAAAEAVARGVGPGGLQGLVNNAGFGYFLPVECFQEDAWNEVFNVNVTGVLRCTQAFLPMLRAGERRGRIVNMSSIAGSLSFPLFGAYAGSKFALEAMSDALRFELEGQGIAVSIIKPGPVVTDIWRRGRDGSYAFEVSEEGRRLYGDLIDKTKRLTEQSEAEGIPPEDVARVVLSALTAPSPRSRYVVGTSAPALQVLRRLLPDRLFNPLISSYYKKM